METKKMALLLLFCAIPLSGCETLNEVFSIWEKHPFEGRKYLRRLPKEPTGNFTQKDVAEYVIDGKAAWMDCRNKAEALTLIAK